MSIEETELHEHEHDDNVVENEDEASATKGGTTTRERNASNQKTKKILALAIGAIIVLGAGYGALTYTQKLHTVHNANVVSHVVKPLSPTLKSEQPQPLLQPSNILSNHPVLDNTPLFAQQKPEVLAQLPAPLPAPTTSTQNQPPSLNSLNDSNLPKPQVGDSVPASVASLPEPSLLPPSLPAPTESSNTPSLDSGLPVNADSSLNVAKLSSAPTVSTPEKAKDDSKSLQAISLLTQISDQVNQINDNVNSQGQKISDLENRVQALEDLNAKLAELKLKSVKVEKKHVYTPRKNEVSLDSDEGKVSLIQNKPKPVFHPEPKHKPVDPTPSLANIDPNDGQIHVVSGLNVPGGVCNGLTRGRAYIKDKNGNFSTLGVNDKIGGNVITSITLDQGIKAGNIVYTCR